jgi:hypothetical protein
MRKTSNIAVLIRGVISVGASSLFWVPLGLFAILLSPAQTLVRPASAQTPITLRTSCHEPRGAERGAILDAMREPVQHDLQQSVKFKVSRIRVCGQWAFTVAEPIKMGGEAIQWQHTMCKGDVSHLVGALERKDATGAWTMTEYALCPTDVAWENWPQKYGVPDALFAE